jgi:hypothetical protein
MSARFTKDAIGSLDTNSEGQATNLQPKLSHKGPLQGSALGHSCVVVEWARLSRVKPSRLQRSDLVFGPLMPLQSQVADASLARKLKALRARSRRLTKRP